MNSVYYRDAGIKIFGLVVCLSSFIFAAPKNLHIFLLIGQSNMASRAGLMDEDQQEIKNCYLLDEGDKWVPAKGAFNRFSTVKKTGKFQGLSLGTNMVKTVLSQQKNINIGIVSNARGTTDLGDWKNPKQSLQKEALRRTKKALESGTLKAILWHQGEHDKSDEKVAVYLSRLKGFTEVLRKEFDSPNVPFIAGQLNQFNDKHAAFNKMIKGIKGVVPNSDWVSSDDLLTRDNAHFNREAQIVFGKRYGAKVLKMVYGKTTNTLTKEITFGRTGMRNISGISTRLNLSDFSIRVDGRKTLGKGPNPNSNHP